MITRGNAYNRDSVSGGGKSRKRRRNLSDKFDGNTVLPLTTDDTWLSTNTMSFDVYLGRYKKRIRKNPLCSPVLTDDCSLRVSLVPGA